MSALNPHSTGFAAFSDALYTGVLVFGLSLLLVTWFAALSAGIEELRESRAADRHVKTRNVVGAFWNRVSRHPLTHLLLPVVVLALVVADQVALPYLAPGQWWASMLPIVLAAGVGAVALRVAGAWRRDASPRVIIVIAWRRMADDASGSGLLVLAVLTAGALVAIAPMLLLVILGPVALAAVAMDSRAVACEQDEAE